MNFKRGAGVLMPIFSLFGEYGIGDFGENAFYFVDWLKKAGQSYWQILPLGQTGYGDSPYQSFSTFAGNPYFISLGELIKEKLLKVEECNSFDFGKEERINYEELFKKRFKLLKIAFNRFDLKDKSFLEFCLKNNDWLDDYSLFMAIKGYMGERCWLEWDEDIKLRKEDALENYKNKLKDKIEFYKFIQFLFFRQWNKLKAYANSKGIAIIGDLPIYVAMDSVDVWKNTSLFQFDKNCCPIAVAGCPPDKFSKEGQLWGNPLYNWERHKAEEYSWWKKRIKHALEMYDGLRLDHFRGFDEYYSIPYNSKNGINGRWEKGGGKEFFREIKSLIGEAFIIAEDLGFITDSVKELLDFCGFYSTKVLEFAFDLRDDGGNDHLPHNYKEKSVVYTSTHDNQTLCGWLKDLSNNEIQHIREYLFDFNTKEEKLNFSLISLAMKSVSEICIVPLMDYLSLDDTARINTPSTLGNNWVWRCKKEMLTDNLAEKINEMIKVYGRVN